MPRVCGIGIQRQVSVYLQNHLDVSKNKGTPKSSILIGFSINFTIHFGVPLFLETPICIQYYESQPGG